MAARRSWRLASVAAALALGIGWGCTADLLEIQGEQCFLRFNGECDEPDVCTEGTDIADCRDGSYGACHLLVGAVDSDRCGGSQYCVFSPELPVTWSVCIPFCETDEDCGPPPEGGTAVPTCRNAELSFLPGQVEELPLGCFLDCDNTRFCPDGMSCGVDGYCLWDSDQG